MMSVFNDFHFLRPAWFLALLPLAVLLWYVARKRYGASRWEQVCDSRLLPFILIRGNQIQRKVVLSIMGLVGLFAIAALAGPAWERIAKPALRDDSALIILFDLSASMNAVDVQPSRIVRARYKINDFLDQYQRGQVALVAYSDQAFPVVPLTTGREPIKKFLQAIETGLMPSPGSNPSKGLEYAQQIIERNDLKRGNLLLVTDFADAQAIERARELAQKNFSISVLAVGTAQGSPVFLRSGKILKSDNEVVISRLEESLLRRLANAGQGIYQQLNPQQDNDVTALVKWANTSFANDPKLTETDKFSDVWREEGPWLLLLILPLVLPVFRKGLLTALLFVLASAGLFAPNSAQAFGWEDLWLRSDQQGIRSLEKGDAAAASEQFKDPEWRGVAEYRNGDFVAAAETFKGLSGARHLYNQGNAQVYAGDLQGAVESYDAALQLEPAMEDAIHNRNIVQQMIQQQQMQSEASEDGDPSEDDQDQQKAQQRSDQEDETDDSKQPDRDSLADNEQEAQDEQTSPQDEAENSDQETMSEEEQALEQALKRIEDDTKGLLRRKFQKMNQQNRQAPKPGPRW